MLFPELAGLVQPLAGEWAIRRSLFSRLQVPTGYAVEFAALVDTCRILGLDAIAQVDLGRRAHRHPALRDLGAMATQILAIALRSSGPDGPETVALRQYQPAANAIRATVREVNTGTRPPAGPLLEEPVS